MADHRASRPTSFKRSGRAQQLAEVEACCAQHRMQPVTQCTLEMAAVDPMFLLEVLDYRLDGLAPLKLLEFFRFELLALAPVFYRDAGVSPR